MKKFALETLWGGRYAAGRRFMAGRARTGGFTLVELLVVMAIIAMLITILVPTVGVARRAAMEARARSEIQSIVTAVRSYMNDYSRLPGRADVYGAGTDNRRLFDILRAQTATDNPRQIMYLEIADSSLVNGNYVDAWRNQYRVAFDRDYNNEIDLSSVDGIGRTLSGVQVAAWSIGAPSDIPDDPVRRITSW